jgi:hypothetical protein
VPFLAVMLAGVSEFGRLFQTYNTLAKATRSSARYLSNHPVTDANEKQKATNLVVCGKLTCVQGDPPLVKNLVASNVCIQTTQTGGGSPKIETVTVSIPRNAGDCGNATPYTYAPIFDIGGMLHNNLSLALPLSPSVTMYYMVNLN